MASWRDMETWLVGQGYVDAVASLLGTVRSPWRENGRWNFNPDADRLVLSSCYMGLDRILQHEEGCKLVRERGGIGILTPVSGPLRAVCVWPDIKSRILGQGRKLPSKEMRKRSTDLLRYLNGDLSTPKVCAWPLCNAYGSAHSEVKLLTCARCKAASYCRWVCLGTESARRSLLLV